MRPHQAHELAPTSYFGHASAPHSRSFSGTIVSHDDEMLLVQTGKGNYTCIYGCTWYCIRSHGDDITFMAGAIELRKPVNVSGEVTRIDSILERHRLTVGDKLPILTDLTDWKQFKATKLHL